jgi:uncharacterized Ntn-hydrolase superfamily protein
MTFSIAARCTESEEVGIVIASSSICVASRCAFVRTGVGAALTQNVTDPCLGPAVLDAMEQGNGAVNALAKVISTAHQSQWRQLLAIGRVGAGAIFSGEKMLGIHAEAYGKECVAAGNLLSNESVPGAMVSGFEQASGPLAAKLLTALEAALDAGGGNGVCTVGWFASGREGELAACRLASRLVRTAGGSTARPLAGLCVATGGLPDSSQRP